MDLTNHKYNLEQLFNDKTPLKEKLDKVCSYLKSNFKYFDWVGFYFNNDNKKELKLMSFAGKPTEHTIIPFGKGICGQVAISNENFIVNDVNKQGNYISCGIEVKSEIVIPIFKNGKNIGQINIDSHSINPFTKKDTDLLEFVCNLVSIKIT
jgi:GAF domain-containing protein